MADTPFGTGSMDPGPGRTVLDEHTSTKAMSPTKALRKSMPPEEAARAAAELIRRANAEADQQAAVRARSLTGRQVHDAVAGVARARRVWAARTPMERGLTLTDIGNRLHNVGRTTADEDREVLDSGAERWHWYAKWAAKLDKLTERDGLPAPYGVDPPSGVVVLVATADPSLLELSSLVAPVLASGNGAVVVAPRGQHAVRAVLDALAVESMPMGLVRVVDRADIAVFVEMVADEDIDGIDLHGAADMFSSVQAAVDPGVRVVRSDPDVDLTEKPGKARLRSWARPSQTAAGTA